MLSESFIHNKKDKQSRRYTCIIYSIWVMCFITFLINIILFACAMSIYVNQSENIKNLIDNATTVLTEIQDVYAHIDPYLNDGKVIVDDILTLWPTITNAVSNAQNFTNSVSNFMSWTETCVMSNGYCLH